MKKQLFDYSCYFHLSLSGCLNCSHLTTLLQVLILNSFLLFLSSFWFYSFFFYLSVFIFVFFVCMTLYFQEAVYLYFYFEPLWACFFFLCISLRVYLCFRLCLSVCLTSLSQMDSILKGLPKRQVMHQLREQTRTKNGFKMKNRIFRKLCAIHKPNLTPQLPQPIFIHNCFTLVASDGLILNSTHCSPYLIIFV